MNLMEVSLREKNEQNAHLAQQFQEATGQVSKHRAEIEELKK